MPFIVVTGVSSGIGQATAELFAREGWTVVGTVRGVERMEGHRWGGDVRLEEADFAEPGAGEGLAARVLERHGVPDVLVNNAAALLFGPVEDATPAEIAEIFRVNVFEPVALAKGFVPAWREQGSGLIVNVTSLGGRMVFPFFAVYNASKHALEGFSEGMWHELKEFGIRVKAVEPGFVETPIYDKAMRGEGELKHVSTPYREQVEAMVAFEADIGNRTSPEGAAREVRDVVLDESDRLRYPIAAYARPLIAARRWLGEMTVMRFYHKKWLGRRG